MYATYTGHIFDTTLDIYFAEACFYDAATRQWLAMDLIKDGGNWYQYCYSNPLRYWDPLGLEGFVLYGCNIDDRIAELSEQLKTMTGIEYMKTVMEIRGLAYMKKTVAMSVSEQYITFLKSYETGADKHGNLLEQGLPALTRYHGEADKEGVFTIGWGHQIKEGEIIVFPERTVILSDPDIELTKDEAEYLLRLDIAEREKDINTILAAYNRRETKPTNVVLTQGMYDAVFDLYYQMGTIFDDDDFSSYLKNGDFRDENELKIQFGEYTYRLNKNAMMRRVDELEMILESDYERTEDYKKYGDIFRKLSYPNTVNF